MNAWEQIFYNIVGGGLVSILTYFGLKLFDFYSGYRFKNIFGPDSKRDFKIVYGLMELFPSFDQNGKPTEWPYSKADVPGSKFRISSPVSAAQMRTAKYIAEAFSKNLKVSPSLVPDSDLRNKLDISYCSVGGINNLKTLDILDHEENIFFNFELSGGGSILVISKRELKFTNDGIFDYGFIIKLVPRSFENRVWVAIAGIGEWGTSGAAWYLARNWKIIEKKYGGNPFGIIIKVKGAKDESATLVYESE